MRCLLEINGLAKHYEGFDLTDVSLSVEPGCVVGFVGANGAGKTTTIKAALGLVEPDAGSIKLFGQEVAVDDAGLAEIKSRIGVVLDTCAFPDECRLSDVALIGRAAYATWDQRRFEQLAAHLELPIKKKVKELSRGMGMKLTLAFALAHHPDLLVLDEATAGLDPMAREDVLEILRKYVSQGDHGILMSTHITSDLEKVADEVVCLNEGTVRFDLPKDTITDKAGVARCRASELEAALASDLFKPGQARFIPNAYSTDLLVPDRFAFAQSFPDVVVDKASIEDYMTLTLKGESR